MQKHIREPVVPSVPEATLTFAALSAMMIPDTQRGYTVKNSMISAILLALGLCGMIGSLTWVLGRGNRNRLTKLFISCQSSIVLWLVSELLILFSVTTQQYRISYLIGNLGISCFGPLWLMLTAEYAESPLKTRNRLNLTLLISFASMLVISTNDRHHLYYSVFEAGKREYGPLFYVFQLIYYICIITGFVLIGLKHKRKRERINKQSVLLILSAAIPLVVNTLSVADVFHNELSATVGTTVCFQAQDKKLLSSFLITS